MLGLVKKIVRKAFGAVHLGTTYKWMRSKWHEFLRELRMRREKREMRQNYAKIVNRIRHYPKDRKIRVLFWVYETAKWKAQSLYDEMKASSDFEPIIVLSVTRDDLEFYGKGIREKILADEKYYTSRGCRCITNFDFSTERPFPLERYEPDIVFYHDPRWLFKEDSLRQTARTALCCDIPYAIRTLAGDGLQNAPEHHQLMFLQFPPTEAQSRSYRKSLPEWKWAGKSCAIGHPILDQYLQPAEKTGAAEFVIYAPHWSFAFKGVKRQTTLSSFLENGRQILEYAQRHPKFKWVFKPHPLLYKELIKRGVWTREDVDAYYEEWGKIGNVCTDGDYILLFRNSKALITDCGSFLVEYPMTGKPLIRLIPKELDYPLFPAFENLYNSFYEVRNLDEMYATFAQVLERGEDPRKEARLKAVQELGLMGNGSSAGRIIMKLREICRS